MAGGAGYFAPGLVLMRLISTKMREYRNGFPDFMDLMIVCSDAGMSMEAGIERVATELSATYPSLSQNLQLVSLELRAGRSLDDALKSLADRMSLDEVRSFATLLQQSKELGTSLSGALRVFSDEMRHKRMSKAEEKAHSLPAKMSVPVTVCILPVVLMIAIIPIIVKMTRPTDSATAVQALAVSVAGKRNDKRDLKRRPKLQCTSGNLLMPLDDNDPGQTGEAGTRGNGSAQVFLPLGMRRDRCGTDGRRLHDRLGRQDGDDGDRAAAGRHQLGPISAAGKTQFRDANYGLAEKHFRKAVELARRQCRGLDGPCRRLRPARPLRLRRPRLRPAA